MIWLPIVLLGFAPGLAAEAPVMPEQAARGKAIFLDSLEKKTQCATCHQIDKDGTAIGPDLKRLARLSPRAIQISVLSTRTVYVKELETTVKGKMPVMVASENKKELTVYNLAVYPPERLVIERSAIAAIRDNATWQHPPQVADIKAGQLADVLAYIRYAAFGDTKGVDAEELQ